VRITTKNIINKTAILGAASAVGFAALTGCTGAADDEPRPAADATSRTTTPPSAEPTEEPADLTGLVEGDTIHVPAVADTWGEGTVWKDVAPGSHSVVVKFTVPVEVVELADSPDPIRMDGSCTTVEVPDLDGISPIRVDAPNGAGDVFEISDDGASHVAPLICVTESAAGDTPLLQYLDEAKGRALKDGTLTIRATVAASEVAPGGLE